MRTAERILDENIMGVEDWIIMKKKIINAINEARKEAIETCAEKAEMICDYGGCNLCENHKVDKEQILSLLNQLK